MLRKLRGISPFIIWDQAQQGMLIAATHSGSSRSYRRRRQDAAPRFAVKALLAGGGVDAAPEPAGHVGFFV